MGNKKINYTIEIYKNGFTKAPGPEMYYLSDWEKEYLLYTYVFIIKGGGYTILIDTGCRNIDLINNILLEEFKGRISFEIPKDETIEAIITKAKINPEKVDYVFLTHLHHDHASNVDLFQNAKVVLSKYGWTEYMKKERSYYYDNVFFPIAPMKYISSLPLEKLILVEKDDTEILPGIKTFWVGGHTPCCMAIEIQTEIGRVILTSDVSFLINNIIENKPIGLFYNLWEVFDAYKKIRNKEVQVILTSHDPIILDKMFTNGKLF